MLEITNNKKFPVQLIIKGTKAPRTFATLNIPGIGAGKNIFYLQDERSTDYIDKAVNDGLISIKYVPNKLRKGE